MITRVWLLVVSSWCLYSYTEVDQKTTKWLWQPTLCESIFKRHIRSLAHTRIEHKPLVVCFSGVPGMGKTHVAKIIEQTYQAVRVSADDIRAIIGTITNGQTTQFLTQVYILYFFLSYTAPNKFIVLDMSIDRNYRLLFPYLKLRGIPYVVVRINTPYEQVVACLTQREKANHGTYIQFLPSWYADYDAFGACCEVTTVLNNDMRVPIDLTALVACIKSYL
jgi:hypothetical protein